MAAMVMPAATVVMAGKAGTEAERAGMAVDCYKYTCYCLENVFTDYLILIK